MTVSTPVQQHIRILDAQGLSWRRIAREVGVSRQTVRKYAELEVYFVKSVFRVGAGAVLLDSSLIPSPPIMPQDRARVDDP